MKYKKMHILDIIFIIGIIAFPIIGVLIDSSIASSVNYNGYFPVFFLLNIFPLYILFFILIIYSNVKYKLKEQKPKLVRWYMFFAIQPIYMLILLLLVRIVALFYQ